MTNIITFDGFENSDIRVTPSGEYSVFDVIKFCGKKNPRDAWNTLLTQYSEVVAKTDNFKFPGRGQRNTPVATRQNISMLEDVAVSFAEQLTQRDIERQNLNGFHPCKDSAAKNAANVSRLVND